MFDNNTLRFSPDLKVSNINLWELIQELCAVNRKDLISIIIYAFAIGIGSLILPLTIQELVNILSFGIVIQPLIVVTGLLIIFLSLVGFFEIIEFYIVELIQHKIFLYYFEAIYVFIKENADNWNLHSANLIYEIFLLQKSYQKLLFDGVMTSCAAVISLIAMSFYHYYFALLSIVILFFIALILFVIGKNGIQTAYQESNAKYNLLELMQGYTVTKQLDTPIDCDQMGHDYLQTRMKHFHIILRQKALVLVVGVIANALLLGLGGWLVIHNQLSLGQLVAAELMLNIAIAAFNKLSNLLNTFFDLMIHLLKLETLRRYIKLL